MAHANPGVTAVSAGITSYFYPCGSLVGSTTETNHQVVFHYTGTMSNFLVNVYDNTLNGSTTLRTRVSTSNGTQSVSVPAGTTGVYEDDTNLDMIEDGDLYTYQLAAGGSSGEISCNIMRTLFSSDVDTVTRMVCSGLTTYNVASASRHNVTCGDQGGIEEVEARTRCRQRKIGTYKNLAAVVSTNTRTTSSTVKLRKEEADTGIVATIGAGLTGIFEDTTHSTTVAVLDDINFQTNLGTGVGDLGIRSLQIDYVSLNSTGVYVSGNSIGEDLPEGETKYLPIMGVTAFTSTEANISVRSGFVQADFLELTTKVTENNLDNTSTLSTRRNGVNGNLSVTIPANTTGTYTDVSDTLDSTFPADEINIRLTAGAGIVGDTIIFTNICIWAFIIPFVGQQSLAMPSPVLENANQRFQNSFISPFQRPIFGA